MRAPGLLLALVVAACTPAVGRDPAPLRVVAEFDPGAAVPVVPTPNDLALDASTGLLAVPDAPDATEAERQLNRYLRTLDGFPTSATAVSRFSAPLAPESVTADAVRVLDITHPAAVVRVMDVSVRYVSSRREVEVTAPFEKARAYAIALLAGEGGLRGAEGEEVVGSAAFALLRVQKPLTTCADLSSPDCRSVTRLIRGDSPEQERERVVALEEARLRLRPALAFLENEGLERNAVAAAWTFRTVRAGLVTFAPEDEVIPFPNDLLIEDGHVALPAEPGDDALAAELKSRLNQLDGFSTTASILSESGAAVGAADRRLDAASIDAAQFRLINLDTPTEPVPFTVACRSCGHASQAPGAEPDQVALTPARPLRSHTRYAVLWLKGARTLEDARPVAVNPVFALARLSTPVFDGVRSTLRSVDDLTAVLLEPLRQTLQLPLEAADAAGIPREDVLLAFSFVTQTTAPTLPPLRARPAQWQLDTGVVGGPTHLLTLDLSRLAQVSVFSGQDVHSSLRWAKEGEILSGNALDPAGTEIAFATGQPIPTEGAFTPATLAQPRQEQRRFLLVTPKTPRHPDGRIPVVIFHHGLNGSRRDALGIANSLAKAGFATLAIDAPFHGLRTFCQSDAQCQPGVQCTGHRCPDALLDPNDGYRVRTVPFLGADPLETPSTSGDQFISTTNLFANRDRFHQQLIDLAQLLRALADTSVGIGSIDVDDPGTAGVVERLEPRGPRYIGQSLGGIIGTLASAALPELSSSTLNVPGASLTDVILTASSFQSQKAGLDAYLAGRGTPPGTQAYEQFLDTARWVLDPADPQNVGRHLIAEPLVDPGTQAPFPRKRIFVSWILNDATIPNASTELLLRSIDSSPAPANFKEKRYQGGNHAFLLDLTPGGASLAITAQTEAVEWVSP